jgi:hypothetical protein
MKTGTAVLLLLLGLAGAVVGFGLGKRLYDRGGISLEDAAELARAAGDSAVTAYREHVDDLVLELRDSIAYYQGEARLAARLELRRPSVRVVDTVEVPAAPAGDSSAVVPLYLDTLGVHLVERLTITPPPTAITRELELTFDPDTLAFALLRLPSGLDRVTAAATSFGLEVRVLDAAQVAQDRGRHWFGWDVLHAGACLAAGLAGGRELAGEGTLATTIVLGAGGTACAVGTVLRF